MLCMYVSHQAFNFDQIETVRSLHTCALVLRKPESYFSTKSDQLRLQLYTLVHHAKHSLSLSTRRANQEPRRSRIKNIAIKLTQKFLNLGKKKIHRDIILHINPWASRIANGPQGIRQQKQYKYVYESNKSLFDTFPTMKKKFTFFSTSYEFSPMNFNWLFHPLSDE